MPEPMRNKVVNQSAKLMCIAKWLGQVTVAANHFPAGTGPNGKCIFIRDTEAKRRPKGAGQKRKAEQQLAPAHPLAGDERSSPHVQFRCPRLRAVHERVCARLAAKAAESLGT